MGAWDDSTFFHCFLYTWECGKHASLVEGGPGGADGWAGGVDKA